jgi:ATP-binding protein involved in chromosome partitioning
MNALEQMLYKTDWGDIDILIIDLPPGTGDAQLSICQRTPLTGAIIVCTPQDLALLDAVRGINMFRKVNVPVIGIIENMSYHICSKCGDIEYIFGKDGAKRTAEKMKINFLGEIPLHSKIRETSDFGKPISIIEPNSTHAISYLNISKRVIEIIENENFIKEKPNIVIE